MESVVTLGAGYGPLVGLGGRQLVGYSSGADVTPVCKGFRQLDNSGGFQFKPAALEANCESSPPGAQLNHIRINRLYVPTVYGLGAPHRGPQIGIRRTSADRCGWSENRANIAKGEPNRKHVGEDRDDFRQARVEIAISIRRPQSRGDEAARLVGPDGLCCSEAAFRELTNQHKLGFDAEGIPPTRALGLPTAA